MIALFFKSILIGYSGALMPGSLLTYTIDKSIKHGSKSGLLISIGHALLEFVIVVLLLFGLGKYLGSHTAKIIIGIAGGALLGFLGIGMIRDAFLNKLSIEIDKKSNGRQGSMLAGGAIISASNPYFIFWWAVVGLGLITSSYSAFGILGVAVFYLGHIMSDISWYTFISALVSKTRTFVNQKVYKVVIIVLGLCMVGFGASFIYNSLV